MGESTWEDLHSEPIRRYDSGTLFDSIFTKGGVNLFSKSHLDQSNLKYYYLYGFREGFYGWFGYGGSVF